MVFLRRIVKFKHMDFEYASWQMLLLLVTPHKVYKNFQYQKHTKHYWARDDPAFLVLLAGFLFITSVAFTVVLHNGVLGFFLFLLWVVFIDCIGIGLLIATLMWFICNRVFQSKSVEGGTVQRVEWAYAFDVHLNSFFPMMVVLHGIQILLWWPLTYQTIFSVILSDVLWFVGISYYIFITFLGYSTLPFLQNTVFLLYAFVPISVLAILAIPMQWNWTLIWKHFYSSF